MPHISTGLDGTILAGIVGNFYPVQQSLGSSNLIRPHGHQDFLLGKDAETCEDIEQGVTAEESCREILQVTQNVILCIRPVTRELK